MNAGNFFRHLFGRKPSLRGPAELADFIDENAAFLVQKGIYDYSRARSGPYAKVLLADEGFQGALDRTGRQSSIPDRISSPRHRSTVMPHRSRRRL